eukprot:g13150.t1
MDPTVEATIPKADLTKTEEFESKRCGYFADEYRKSSLYWASLCELMSSNAGSTNQVLTYIAARLETDRVYTSSIYANADKVFGDKKGAAKLRHDKIRHAEVKAKLEGKTASITEDSLVAGGGGRDPGALPQNGPVKAIWEMAEMDCRAARQRDVLCDELEQENLLGKVKAMGKETERRFKELSDEGNACLLSLANIDKRVGQAFIHLKETLGDQLGGKALHEDVWFLDCNYRTAVVHQKEAWNAVTVKLREVFGKMKDLEAERRKVLREFMIEANAAIGSSWSKLRSLCGPAMDMANAVDPNHSTVDREVATLAAAGMEAKKRAESKDHELANVTSIIHADPAPSDTSFIDSLTAPLESPLVRCMMMVERRHGNNLKSSYSPGLMVLSWEGFIHFFDLPASSNVKQDASAAAAFQEISPTISLDDLLTNKKDLEEVLMFKSTHTLQLDEASVVEAVSSQKKKSHKIEVKGKTQITSIKRHFGSGTTHKAITFRTPTEAEMNHALDEITDSISIRGGMKDATGTVRQSSGSRTSFGSFKSDSGSTKTPAGEAEKAPAAAPVPAPSSTVPPAAEATSAPAAPAAAAPAAPAAAGEGSSEAAATAEPAPTAAAASPTMTFEELEEQTRILVEEWERLPEEDKTPYRERATERRLQHETVDAAIALTQIGTPFFLLSDPATPAPRAQKVRRSLDIGSPGWQSPRVPENSYCFGYDDDDSNNIASTSAAGSTPSSLFLSSTYSASPTTSSSTPSTSSGPPALTRPGLPLHYSASPYARGAEGVIHRRHRHGVAGRVMSSTVAAVATPATAATAAAVAAVAAVSTLTPESGSVRGDGGFGPAVAKVGLEVRTAAGKATNATSKQGGSGPTQVAAATSHSLGGSNKPIASSAGSRKRKASSRAPPAASSKRAQPSSSSKNPTVAAAAAAAAAKAGTTMKVKTGAATAATASKKNRSMERACKEEYKDGREIVSKMSKKDPARPKGPQSSYILFYAEKMASVKAAKPHMSITDIGAAVGEAWRGLPDEQRRPYTKRAEADRKRYEGQLRAIARKAAVAAAR